MIITKETEYAVLGLIGLANQKEEYTDVKNLANKLGLSISLLSKIFQKLAKDKIIDSKFGPTGGFKLIKQPQEVTLFQIMDSIQGETKLMKCFNGKALYCNPKKCYMKNIIKTLENEIDVTLKNTTLERMMNQ